jgi:uncharacterized protein (DUF433 family)
MSKEYIEQRDGGFGVGGSRISLDSIVYAWRRGASPDCIQKSFPLLTLEEVYGAITFYLANNDEIDAYLIQEEIETEKMRQASREKFADWYERMEKARQELLVPQV